LLARVKAEGAVVPSIWSLEVANGLLAGERRRRVTREKAVAFARALASFPIEVDTSASRLTTSEALANALRYGLTPCDATYVEVALAHQLPLACNDRPMQTAATAAGIEVL
jgi:predicted nucleic acid-binding protein